jgi:dihydroxy-acid dehydratase
MLMILLLPRPLLFCLLPSGRAGGAFVKPSRLSLSQCSGNTRCGRANAGATSLNMKEVNKYSKVLTQQKKQGASQAMLYATGLKEEDLNKAQVGISSVWYEGNPCNMHLMDLAAEVKKGVQDAGMVGYRFNTIGVSDGISMGTDGMSYSLQSRDLIADSIETVMGGQWYDGNIALPGCDKNMPGTVIAMARHNRPSIMVYGGTIRAGTAPEIGRPQLDIVSAFQSYGEFTYGNVKARNPKY